MKILHVFPFFSVKYAGGTCDLMYKLAKAQIQRGHEVTIYAADYMFDKEYADSLQKVTFKTFSSYLNSLRLYIMPGMMIDSNLRIEEFDVIHLHALRTYQNIVIHHFAKKHNIPYVVDAHGSAPRHTRRRKFKSIFDILYSNKILRDSYKCIAETNIGIEEYKELGVPEDKIILIQPPFPVESFTNLPSKGHFRDKYKIYNERIIMFLGRIHRIKGIDFLVESFYELTKIRNNVRLVIVGSDDGFKINLDEMIRKLNLEDKVLFTGFMSGNDKLTALVDADIVVQTSRYEQGAWAPIEAVLCNTPIIVSSNSGAGEDVKKMNAGYLVEWGNKIELRDMMQKILDNSADALNKTKRAKEYIQSNLSMSNKILEYEKLYSDCINSKR